MQFFIFFQCFSSFLHLQWFGVIIVIPCLSYGLLPQFFFQFPRASAAHWRAQLSIFAQVDAVGNAWVAGYTTSSLDGHTNAGSWDIFLMKFDAQGVHLWTRQRGGEDFDYAHGLQADWVRRGFSCDILIVTFSRRMVLMFFLKIDVGLPRLIEVRRMLCFSIQYNTHNTIL